MQANPVHDVDRRPEPAHPPAVIARATRDPYWWLPIVGWSFLTFNSVTAIYRCWDEPWTVAFVVGSFCNLLLLFWCLREFEKARDPSERRNRLKVLLWLLTSSLTIMFSYKVASIMPLVMKVVIWIMAALTTVAGFYALIVHQEKGGL